MALNLFLLILLSEFRSDLGPVLFSLYLSDFGNILSYCKYNFYLIVYLDCELSRLMEIIMKINKELNSIIDWAMDNQLFK